MINPYTSYSIAFAISLLTYGLGWSKLYPPLSLTLFGFIGSTIILHLILSYYWKTRINPNYTAPTLSFNPVIVTIFIYTLWFADFAYEGGIPLVKILTGQPYNYRLFGVPSLHVFTVTFGSFFTVYLFSLFVHTQKRLYLLLYFINLFAALLIYSRAMLIFNISASMFVYFLSVPKFSWKGISFLVFAPILLIYFFGLLGTLRVSFESKKTYNSDIFLNIGRASDSFRELAMPKEFFWGYIYLSSPLANLQENINTFTVPQVSVSRVIQHVYNEMTYDFISKRINRVAGVEREIEHTLRGTPFNVSTAYSRSYSYQSWVGMIIMAVFILAVPLIYVKLLPVNRYQVSAVAILNTMFLFLFYDNTIRFTGLGLQLIYPFVLPALENAISLIQRKLAL